MCKKIGLLLAAASALISAPGFAYDSDNVQANADWSSSAPPDASVWLECHLTTYAIATDENIYTVGSKETMFVVVNTQSQYLAEYRPDLRQLRVLLEVDVDDTHVSGYYDMVRRVTQWSALTINNQLRLNRITLEVDETRSTSEWRNSAGGESKGYSARGPCAKTKPLPVGGGQEI